MNPSHLQAGLMKPNMAMTPEERNRLDRLENLVQSLLRVENVEFLKSIERRVDFSEISPSGKATGSENTTVNEAGTGSHVVLSAPDGWVRVGPNQNIPTYND